MSIVEIIGIASSISLLAGWRLYLCIFAVGLGMRLGWVPLPEHLQSLSALANGWVIGIAGTGAVAEFFVDKVAWVDSLWDTIHTLVRPVGGALLALALVDSGNPAWQLVVLLLGGGATTLSHGAKAGSRALVNTSPEPVSNIVVSSSEDLLTGGLLIATLSNPVAAAVIAAALFVTAILILMMLRRLLRRHLVKTVPD
ncbi:MAG: DUF4126 domain-containing protein [Verrucomicrobiaceae bacterium]|nr:MAG: DUF4126 domain-containing protein [Verrucomicrobiaceae bacterium]